ncbi:MAG: hypothetical protein A3E87_08460 [Gammaproteobacteria bacterium RIFCSPHIGHO2_12_FULL_35_23]|nr:MAG: hypothetical protein A3E87_08460 [Gammaproteobacteria bacterium RIFCSPHIGHO2_12_FULL_35_23]
MPVLPGQPVQLPPAGKRLLDAVKSNNFGLVQQLFRENSNINTQWFYQDSHEYKLLHWAVVNTNLEMVRFLFSKNVSRVVTDTHKRTAIQLAADQKKWGCVIAIAEHPTDETDKACYYSALVAAIQANQHVVVKALLAAQTPDKHLQDNNTLLHIAAATGHENVITELLASRFNSCTNTPNSKNLIPIQIAVQKGRMQAVKLLHTADPSTIAQLDDAGNTLLHLAAIAGHAELIKELIDMGCNIAATNANNKTSIELAVEQGHWHCVTAILEKFPKTDDSDSYHYDAVLYLAVKANNIDMINALLTAGASLNYTYPSTGNHAFHAIAAAGHVNLINYFIDEGYSTSVLNYNNQTPIQLAVEKGNWGWVSAFLSKEPYEGLGSHKKNYFDVLIAAVKAKQIEIVRTILKSNSSLIDNQDSQGNTALHYAVENDDAVMTCLLIENYADTSIQNYSRQTPVELAIAHKKWSSTLALYTKDTIFYSDLYDQQPFFKMLAYFNLTYDLTHPDFQSRWDDFISLLTALKDNPHGLLPVEHMSIKEKFRARDYFFFKGTSRYADIKSLIIGQYSSLPILYKEFMDFVRTHSQANVLLQKLNVDFNTAPIATHSQLSQPLSA